MPSKKKLMGSNEMPKERIDKCGKYKILPVRNSDDFGKIEKDVPECLKSIFDKNGGTIVVYASPGSGKSNFISNLLMNENLLKDVFHGGLYVISPTIHTDDTARYLKDYADFVSDEFSEELVGEVMDNLQSVDKDVKEMSCIVFDDCLGLIKQNSICCKMASRTRHLKLLGIYSTQSVKSIPPNLRSNVSHSVIFYNPSSKQIKDIAEYHSGICGEKKFMELYREACSVKYQFLFCDFRSLKIWKWGPCDPELVYSKYNDDGTVNMEEEISKGDLTSDMSEGENC